MSDRVFVKEEDNPEYWRSQYQSLLEQFEDLKADYLEMSKQMSIYKSQCNLYKGVLNDEY